MDRIDTKVSILIVDDNSVNRQVLSFILQDHYSNLHTAENGAQCLNLLSQQHFDLVLLDLNMPVMSGFEALEEIEAQNLSQRPAFIVVSSDNNPTTISRALRLGASDYVTTPFNRDELLARVKTHLALHSREQDLEERVMQRTAELEAANDELQRAQNQLVVSEKMASLGLLSAGIAHEINNPIGYIRSNLDSLQHYTQELTELIELYERAEQYISEPKALESIEQHKRKINLPFLKEDLSQLINDSLTGSQRVKQIVTDLKIFAYPEQHNWEKLDLRECIQSVLNIVNSEVKYKAEIELNIDPELPTIECITTQIYQVLTNLLINAAQAIEEQGRITISVLSLRPEEDAVQITIRDTGCGMSQDVINKIFDPFFTTKAVGQGTGLGLSVSYGIIEAHLGSIQVESQPGQGTCFTLSLPVTQS